MSNKLTIESTVCQLTDNGEYKYPWINTQRGEVIFTKSFNTAYFDNKTFKKIKGGGAKGGNYHCIEDNNEYRIWK